MSSTTRSCELSLVWAYSLSLRSRDKYQRNKQTNKQTQGKYESMNTKTKKKGTQIRTNQNENNGEK